MDGGSGRWTPIWHRHMIRTWYRKSLHWCSQGNCGQLRRQWPLMTWNRSPEVVHCPAGTPICAVIQYHVGNMVLYYGTNWFATGLPLLRMPEWTFLSLQTFTDMCWSAERSKPPLGNDCTTHRVYNLHKDYVSIYIYHIPYIYPDILYFPYTPIISPNANVWWQIRMQLPSLKTAHQSQKNK